jgi:hypothetical protein
VGHSAQKFSKKKLFSLRVPGWWALCKEIFRKKYFLCRVS